MSASNARFLAVAAISLALASAGCASFVGRPLPPSPESFCQIGPVGIASPAGEVQAWLDALNAAGHGRFHPATGILALTTDLGDQQASISPAGSITGLSTRTSVWPAVEIVETWGPPVGVTRPRARRDGFPQDLRGPFYHVVYSGLGVDIYLRAAGPWGLVAAQEPITRADEVGGVVTCGSYGAPEIPWPGFDVPIPVLSDPVY